MPRLLLLSRSPRCGTIFGLFASLLLLVAFSAPAVTGQSPPSNLASVDVALYNGGHSQENAHSKTALTHLFQWMQAVVHLLDPANVSTVSLSGYDILVMPGISPYTVRDEIGDAGLDIIRGFVADGGAYFGIYGGMYFEWPGFPLFNVILQAPAPGILAASPRLGSLSIHLGSLGPDLSGVAPTISTMVWSPGYFEAVDSTIVHVVASYPENGLPAMVCFQHGDGVVFLSSPHPEFEEGETRDGTTYNDALADPDSEWALLMTVACWLASPTWRQPTNPAPPSAVLFAAAGVIVVAGALGGVYYYRRRAALRRGKHN